MIKGQMSMRKILFAEEYLKCGCAAKAARESGYSTAYCQHLIQTPEIREYLEKRRAEIKEKVPLTEDILRVIAEVATGEKKASELKPDDKAQLFAARIITNSMRIGNSKY